MAALIPLPPAKQCVRGWRLAVAACPSMLPRYIDKRPSKTWTASWISSCCGAERVFAILICCGLDSQEMQEAMPLFHSLSLGLEDSKLPILFEDDSSPLSIFYSSTE